MKRAVMALILMSTLSVAGAAFAGGPSAGKNDQQSRNLSGQVLTSNDQPLPSAVVYLKNTKTLAVKSFITENDGGYRFPALAPNVDYEVYAEFQGQRSSTKTLSSFDSRANVTMNLHIDLKK
jgi:hypothetical protein